MKRISILLFAALFILSAHAGVSSAKLGRIAKKLVPCGNGELCTVNDPGFTSPNYGPAYGGGTTGSSNCETTTWGNSSVGGTETVCAGSNGSSSWHTAEWFKGRYFEDSGTVIHNADGSVTTTSTSSETTSTTTTGSGSGSGYLK